MRAYEGRLRVREKRHPKLFWVDAGVVRGVRGQVGRLTVEERGPLFEGWVANLLRIHADYSGELFDEWFYWAPGEASRTEVDFLLRRGRDWLALEAKSSTRVGGEALRGLRAVADQPRLVRRLLVYDGPRRLRTSDGIEVWPIRDLHTALADGRLWP